METLVNAFLKSRSKSETNLNNADTLTYAVALAICMGWLVLLSFSLANILESSF